MAGRIVSFHHAYTECIKMIKVTGQETNSMLCFTACAMQEGEERQTARMPSETVRLMGAVGHHQPTNSLPCFHLRPTQIGVLSVRTNLRCDYTSITVAVLEDEALRAEQRTMDAGRCPCIFANIGMWTQRAPWRTDIT